MKQNDSTKNKPSVPPAGTQGWISLNRFLDQIGLSRVTAWRWRRRGWLKAVNVAGRLYLSPTGLAEFEARATSGEFSKANAMPMNPAQRSAVIEVLSKTGGDK